MFEIDELIHQPVRTKIMAYLVNKIEADYTSLKKDLEITDGHMSTHMKKLVDGKYISFKKSFEGNKPKTRYKLTKKGKDSFLQYLENLKSMV